MHEASIILLSIELKGTAALQQICKTRSRDEAAFNRFMSGCVLIVWIFLGNSSPPGQTYNPERFSAPACLECCMWPVRIGSADVVQVAHRLLVQCCEVACCSSFP